MKLTINIDPAGVLKVLEAEDGKACVLLSIRHSIEMALNCEERAGDVMEMLMDEEEQKDCYSCLYRETELQEFPCIECYGRNAYVRSEENYGTGKDGD